MSQPNLSERLGIAGSGAIATGLARLAAPLGQVVVWARSEPSAERVRAETEGAVEVVTTLDDLAVCSCVVEAIVEDSDTKCAFLGELGRFLEREAIVATTTSSLSVSKLAEASQRPDRFAAIHFFNPVEKMDLVELAFPSTASPSTRARALAFCDSLGKTSVEVPDAPGFVVNRLLFPYLFAAVRMLDEDGLSPESVDSCMKLGAGHPMGPLALLDFVGLDVAAAIGRSIGEDVPARVDELVAEGRLGRKSGAGFYEYA